MTLSNRKSSIVVPIDADERVLRNISKNDPYGAARPLCGAERERFIRDVLSAAEGVTPWGDSPPPRQFTIFHAVAAAVALVGAGAALFFALIRIPERPAEPLATPAPKTEKSFERGTKAAFEKQTEVALLGPKIFSPSSGIDIALGQGGRATVRHPSDAEVEVYLSHGTLWSAVDPDVPHDRLTVVTDDGRVEVKGTVFYVSKEAHRSEVRVLRGKVQIRDQEGRRTLLPAGRKADVGALEDRPMDEADIDAGWSAVAAASLAPRPVMNTAHPALRPVVKSNRTAKSPPSETELLEEIRALRLDGNWQGTADKYETLIRIHRTSPAARAALISLGDLRLEKLHAPAAALDLFNRYLRLNEPTLAREALLGKANALFTLGRGNEATVVLREFLRRYPDAVQADAVRKRLNETRLDSF